MARNHPRSPVTGKHRVARRTKIAMGAIGLAIAVGALAVAVTAGHLGQASADPADPSFFIDINKVPSGNNVNAALKKKGAQGTFTVDCGTDADGGHQNPDNFIAQPGIKNGAQHLHDYVGNLTTNANSSLQSLLKGGTTCKNGDKSAYFWPVIRIDRADNATQQSRNQKAKADQKAKGVSKSDAQQQADQQANGGNNDQNAQDQNNADQNAQDQNAQDQQNGQQDQQQNTQNKKQRSKNRNQNNQNSQDQNAQDQNNADQNAQDQQNAQQDQQNGQNQQNAQQQNAQSKKRGKNNNQNNQNQNNNNQNNKNNNNQNQQLGGIQGANKEVGDNDGTILEPESATLQFVSGGANQVKAMPLGLKILYGDAKEALNGPANQRPSWTCTGFEDRLTDHYPICPQGSKVERIHAFPNCWDGKNTDSANHRTHIVFANQQGKCPKGFVNVPQLTVTLVYNVPHDVQVNGQYKVDAFAEEAHNPRSDHDDFANVMSNAIMNRLVGCINNNKTCKE